MSDIIWTDEAQADADFDARFAEWQRAKTGDVPEALTYELSVGSTTHILQRGPGLIASDLRLGNTRSLTLERATLLASHLGASAAAALADRPFFVRVLFTRGVPA